jgi:Fe-S oxidoreductase
LRAALSGHVSDDLLYSDEMHDVLDLCIQCKACKTECPSGVDMAAIKTEWLYHYHQSHGWSMRDRIFARMPDMARTLRGPLASAVNAVNRNGMARAAMQHLFGIDRRRPLPAFALQSFTASIGAGYTEADVAEPSGPSVVLFADTFNNYNDPHIARAAYNLFRIVGYRVIIPQSAVCCGRTRYSKGDLDGARKTVDQALDVLYPLAAGGQAIVGLEPSCIHTFGDETLRLFPGDERARAVASAAVSFERFVAEDLHGLFAAAPWSEIEGPILVHGHCHQKSIEGMAPAVDALSLVGTKVNLLDTSCCGMAGSFGYEIEHAETSHVMAERVLAPAVRALGDTGTVVASGSSCRAQISDVTGRRAMHPCEVLCRSAVSASASAGTSALGVRLGSEPRI